MYKLLLILLLPFFIFACATESPPPPPPNVLNIHCDGPAVDGVVIQTNGNDIVILKWNNVNRCGTAV